MARGHIQKCGKCQADFLEEENIGTLQCFDRLFSLDFTTCYTIKSDHRTHIDNSGSCFSDSLWSSLSWRRWTWRFEDNIPIQSSVLKKLPQTPTALSIINIGEYNRMCERYLHIVSGGLDSPQDQKEDIHMASDDDHDRHDSFEKLSDDDFLSSGNDSKASDSDSADEMQSLAIDREAVIKIVCVARFDWRQKFKALEAIFKKDCEIMLSSIQKSASSQKYWTTLEFTHNPTKRKEYYLRQKGLL